MTPMTIFEACFDDRARRGFRIALWRSIAMAVSVKIETFTLRIWKVKQKEYNWVQAGSTRWPEIRCKWKLNWRRSLLDFIILPEWMGRKDTWSEGVTISAGQPLGIEMEWKKARWWHPPTPDSRWRSSSRYAFVWLWEQSISRGYYQLRQACWKKANLGKPIAKILIIKPNASVEQWQGYKNICGYFEDQLWNEKSEKKELMFVWNVTSLRLLSSFTELSYWTFSLVFHQPLSNWFINKYLGHAMPCAKVNGNRILLKNSHDFSTSFDFSIDTSQRSFNRLWKSRRRLTRKRRRKIEKVFISASTNDFVAMAKIIYLKKVTIGNM